MVISWWHHERELIAFKGIDLYEIYIQESQFDIEKGCISSQKSQFDLKKLGISS
jgi:hypothetical protein